jgi:hypothetical protein
LVEALYKNAPSPKLESLKYLYLYINEIDIDEWLGEQMDPKEVAELTVQTALENEIGGNRYPYFKRKVKSDIILAEYLKGGHVSEARLRNAVTDLDKDYNYLKKQAQNYSNHTLRYNAMRTRDAHAKKMSSLEGAIGNFRARELHPIIINPNKSRSLGIVRRALKFW